LGVAGNYVDRLVTYCEIAGIEPIVLGEPKKPVLWGMIHKHSYL
jgi:hypothetical protein